MVWVADGEIASGLDYGVRLQEHLQGRGMEVVRRSNLTLDSEVPDSAHHFLTGGATSATELGGWMPAALGRVRVMLAQAAAGRSTVTGICLGAQMIAEALWPGSVRHGTSIEVGFARILWRGLRGNQEFIVPAFHYEEVEAARVLSGGGLIRAFNPHSEVQAFDFGTRVRGLQFHPELTPADLRRLVATHRETIAAHGGSVLDAERSIERLAEAWSHQSLEPMLANS